MLDRECILSLENQDASDIDRFKNRALLEWVNSGKPKHLSSSFCFWLDSLGDIPYTTPSLGQLATTGVAYYMAVLEIIEQTAKRDYVARNLGYRIPRGYKFEQDEEAFRTRTVLEDIHHAKNFMHDYSFRKLQHDWGESAYRYESIYHKILPKIEARKRAVFSRTIDLHSWDRIKVALHAGSIFSGLSAHQRNRILIIAGYSPDELDRLKIVGKMGLSGTMSLGIAAAYEALGITAASYGLTNPFLDQLWDRRTLLAVIGSYTLYYLTLAVNAEQNLRLLKNQTTRISPNIMATATYYLLEKFLPKSENIASVDKTSKQLVQYRGSITNWGTRIASLSMEPYKELGWAGTIFIPLVGPSMIFSANIMGAILNGLQAILAEVWLRTYGRG